MNNIKFSNLSKAQYSIAFFMGMIFGEAITLTDEEVAEVNDSIEIILTEAGTLRAIHKLAETRYAIKVKEMDSRGAFKHYASTALAKGVQSAEEHRLSKEAHDS